MGHVSVVASCLAWLIASRLFNWRFSVAIDQWAVTALNLRGLDAAFVAIPMFWCGLALLLISLTTGGWAIATKSPQRRAALCGVALTVTLVIVAGIEMISIARGRPWR